MRFSDAAYNEAQQRMYSRRKGSKCVQFSRKDWADLLIDISKLGGVGDDISDDEVHEAFMALGREREGFRRIPDGIAAKMLQTWWRATH